MNEKGQKNILVLMGILTYTFLAMFIGMLVPNTIEFIDEWKFKVFGTISESVEPCRVISQYPAIQVKTDERVVKIELLYQEKTIAIPDDIYVGENDYINCKITTYSIGNSLINEVEYADTCHYYLLSDKGYFAGNNKGITLFTDDKKGAVKFTQLHVDEEFVPFTGLGTNYEFELAE